MSETTSHNLCLIIRAGSLQQDLTGILDWRRPELDVGYGSDKKESYGVEADGKHIRLSIQKKPCGAITWLEFRRSSTPRDFTQWAEYDPRNDGDEVGWFGARNGNFY